MLHNLLIASFKKLYDRMRKKYNSTPTDRMKFILIVVSNTPKLQRIIKMKRQ